jgi:hypothetical protein
MGSVVCVLFTDLVSSTELMAHLGDATFDALRVEHFAGLRQAFHRDSDPDREAQASQLLTDALASAVERGWPGLERRARQLLGEAAQ